MLIRLFRNHFVIEQKKEMENSVEKKVKLKELIIGHQFSKWRTNELFNTDK